MTSYLFDTTYILPFFGINVKLIDIKDQLQSLLLLKELDFAICTCSLIESKWKALHEFKKTGRKEYLDRANAALESFKSNPYIRVLDPWNLLDASKWADHLYIQGHIDYMDCWIAGTAKIDKRILVTEDVSLKSIIHKLSEWSDVVAISWKEMYSKINEN